MGLGENLRRAVGWPEKEQKKRSLSLAQYVEMFSYGANSYPLGGNTTLGSKQEEIRADYPGLVAGAYLENGVVFACMMVRMLLFAEARFQFRQMEKGRPGDLFGSKALAPLEHPWEGGTTGDLLTRAIQDADLTGNFFAWRDGDAIRRLRPDWMTIVMGSKLRPTSDDPGFEKDAEVIGYLYHPGGTGSGHDPEVLDRRDVAHFAPIPDPRANFRGMSWLTPVIREIMGDKAATEHKLSFFENGATPNLIVTLDPNVGVASAERWIEIFKAENEGLENAYATMFLGGGAGAEVVGANLQEISFKETQGAGETRIAAAAGVPPVIVGLSEGLQAATYSNYGQARRRFADGTIRPLWRELAGTLENIVDVPRNAELWYDDRDIPFVQEDRKDAADVQTAHSAAINTLITAGFEPKSVVAAVTAGDLTRLKHTGKVSVQLTEPGKHQTNGTVPALPELPAPDDEKEPAK